MPEAPAIDYTIQSETSFLYVSHDDGPIIASRNTSRSRRQRRRHRPVWRIICLLCVSNKFCVPNRMVSAFPLQEHDDEPISNTDNELYGFSQENAPSINPDPSNISATTTTTSATKQSSSTSTFDATDDYSTAETTTETSAADLSDDSQETPEIDTQERKTGLLHAVTSDGSEEFIDDDGDVESTDISKEDIAAEQVTEANQIDSEVSTNTALFMQQDEFSNDPTERDVELEKNIHQDKRYIPPAASDTTNQEYIAQDSSMAPEHAEDQYLASNDDDFEAETIPESKEESLFRQDNSVMNDEESVLLQDHLVINDEKGTPEQQEDIDNEGEQSPVEEETPNGSDSSPMDSMDSMGEATESESIPDKVPQQDSTSSSFHDDTTDQLLNPTTAVTNEQTPQKDTDSHKDEISTDGPFIDDGISEALDVEERSDIPVGTIGGDMNHVTPNEEDDCPTNEDVEDLREESDMPVDGTDETSEHVAAFNALTELVDGIREDVLDSQGIDSIISKDSGSTNAESPAEEKAEVEYDDVSSQSNEIATDKEDRKDEALSTSTDSAESKKLDTITSDEKEPAPEGSLASFFEKLNKKKENGKGTLSGTSFEALAAQQNDFYEESVPTRDRSETTDVRIPEMTPEDYEGLPWGVTAMSVKRRVPDMELLYLVFQDRMENDDNFNKLPKPESRLGQEQEVLDDEMMDDDDELVQFLQAHKQEIDSLLQGSDRAAGHLLKDLLQDRETDESLTKEGEKEQLRQYLRESGDEITKGDLVQGLDDIDKFFQGVDPPDELDVGAASGSSMQELIMGKGRQILVKRVIMGYKFMRKVLGNVKARFSSRHKTAAPSSAVQSDAKRGPLKMLRDIQWQPTARYIQRTTGRVFAFIVYFFEGFFDGDDSTEEELSMDQEFDLDAIRKLRGL